MVLVRMFLVQKCGFVGFSLCLKLILAIFCKLSLLLPSSLHFFLWEDFPGRILIGRNIFVLYFLTLAEILSKFRVFFFFFFVSIVSSC